RHDANPPPHAGEGVRGRAEDGWGLTDSRWRARRCEAPGRQDRLGPAGRRGWRNRPRVARRARRRSRPLPRPRPGRHCRLLRRDPAARHIPLVRDLGPEIEGMAGSAPPGYSSGGMVTKLAAARIAMQAGCHMLIAEGRPKLNDIAGPLGAIEAGARATLFLPH